MTKLWSLESPFLQGEIATRPPAGEAPRALPPSPFTSFEAFAPLAAPAELELEARPEAQTEAQTEQAFTQRAEQFDDPWKSAPKTALEASVLEAYAAEDSRFETDAAEDVVANEIEPEWADRELSGAEDEADLTLPEDQPPRARPEAYDPSDGTELEVDQVDEAGEAQLEVDEVDKVDEAEEADEAEDAAPWSAERAQLDPESAVRTELEDAFEAGQFEGSDFERNEFEDDFEHALSGDVLESGDSEAVGFEEEDPKLARSRVSVLLDTPSDADDKFILKAENGSYKKTLNAKDAQTVEGSIKRLVFEAVPGGDATYQLWHQRSSKSVRMLLRGLRAKDLVGVDAGKSLAAPDATNVFYTFATQVPDELPDAYGTKRKIDPDLVAVSPTMVGLSVSEPRLEP